jgi:phage antirepressor YoqD-like protein
MILFSVNDSAKSLTMRPDGSKTREDRDTRGSHPFPEALAGGITILFYSRYEMGKEIELFANAMSRAMTVKQVAEALGVADRTIRDNVAKLFPGLARDGVTTYLDEEQVTAIKQAIEKSGRNDLANVRQVASATTELEIAKMTAKVIGYWKARAEELENKALADAPKIECFEALMRSDKTMSITDCSKHFGLHPKKHVLPYLRERGYLTLSNLPTQAAIDQGYLSLRETKAGNGKVYPQAVVEDCQLETWRLRVVPQIKAWRAGMVIVGKE